MSSPASAPAGGVLVVGGGPAGAAAAIRCALEGLRVSIVEASADPVDRPGETLHPGAEAIFRSLGVERDVEAAGFLRHEGIDVAWDGPSRFVAYGADASGPWRGYQAWRSTLDAILRRRALALGASVIAPCRARGPIVRSGRVRGVLTDRGLIEASFTIDATGPRRVLARAAGLATRALSPRLVARHGYVRRPAGRAPRLTADARGWTWVAEVRDGLYQWTRLDFGQRTDVLVDGEQVGPCRGADVTWRCSEQSAAAGLFVVGDAAAVLDPASSHGVLRAMMSGMQAAATIARIARAEVAEPDAARSYSAWMARWIAHDAAELEGLYAKLPAPPAWASSGRRDETMHRPRSPNVAVRLLDGGALVAGGRPGRR